MVSSGSDRIRLSIVARRSVNDCVHLRFDRALTSNWLNGIEPAARALTVEMTSDHSHERNVPESGSCEAYQIACAMWDLPYDRCRRGAEAIYGHI
jgi:hypothetical protein